MEVGVFSGRSRFQVSNARTRKATPPHPIILNHTEGVIPTKRPTFAAESRHQRGLTRLQFQGNCSKFSQLNGDFIETALDLPL